MTPPLEASDVSDVTLGEVNRNVSGLRTDLRDMMKDVVELKVSNGTTQDKVKRLESIVYGTIATSVGALVTAILSIVIRKN